MFFFIHFTENITEIHVDPELEMLCRTNNGCDAGLNLNEVIPTRPCPTGDKEDYFIYLCEMNKFNFPICGQDLQQVTFYSHVSRLFWCRVLSVKREPSHLICGIRGDRRGPRAFKSAGVQTHLFHFVEEADEPGHPSQPDQAEDAHKHEYPHHLVGFGRVVITVVL